MFSEMTVVPGETSLQMASEIAEQAGAEVLLVGTPQRIVGTVARKKIEEAMRADKSQTVHSLIPAHFVFLYPDDSLDLVLERLGQSPGAVPVLSRNGGKLEGAVTFDSVMQFAQNQPDLPA
jgi:predicted transcriptional regulator